MAVLNIDAAARVLMERVTGRRHDWDRMTEGHRDMYRADVEAVLEAANEPVCTCDPDKLVAVCADIRNEPHLSGCPRWGTRKSERELVKLGICPRSGARMMPNGILRPACSICDCGEDE